MITSNKGQMGIDGNILQLLNDLTNALIFVKQTTLKTVDGKDTPAMSAAFFMSLYEVTKKFETCVTAEDVQNVYGSINFGKAAARIASMGIMELKMNEEGMQNDKSE